MGDWNVLIGGRRVMAESGRTYPVINPATGGEIARLPLCNGADVNRAVEAARRAFPIWSGRSQQERSIVVAQMAQELTGRARELAELESLDRGTPIRNALSGIFESAAYIRRAAEAGIAMMKSRFPVRRGSPYSYLRHTPVGICALVPPWNAPLQMILAKIVSALTVGNTCVVKPPSIHSLVLLKAGEILEGFDLPAGALNVLTGPDRALGGAVAFHTGVDSASFAATSETRNSTMAPPSDFARVLATQLGERNRFVVFDDADLSRVVAKGVFASFNDSGMTYGLPSRFYVHEKVYDEFAARFAAAAESITVGNPADQRTEMGPLASAAHRKRVEAYIESAREQGARLLAGGERLLPPSLNKGYFVRPAVFADVTPSMMMATRDVYCPVACILKIRSAEKLIELTGEFAADLGASVWTTSPEIALRVDKQMAGGFVWLNDCLVLSGRVRRQTCRQVLGEANPFVPLEEHTKLALVSQDLTALMAGKAALSSN